MSGLAGQAVAGLRIVRDGDIVRVDDGADRWLCRGEEWDAALDRLGGAPAIESEDQDEARSEAYTLLCREVAGPIASVIGTSRGNFGPLVRDAVSVGLLEAGEARTAYGVAVAS